jgi:hypothetical protein
MAAVRSRKHITRICAVSGNKPACVRNFVLHANRAVHLMRQRGAGDVSGVGRQGICLQLWRGKFSENADFADREVGNVGRRTRGYEMNVIHVNVQY